MIRSDSRRVKKGDIFVALKGIKSDGHDYIMDAIKNGVSSVVAEHGEYPVDTIIVPDTKAYLKDYVKNHYSHIFDDMTIIGVTGTNGKTTVSYLIHESLKLLGVKCSMIGTLGYYKDRKVFDLPNTCPDLALMYEILLDSYNSGYKCAVIEASSQGLEEDRLYGISFDFCIFTNLTHDHLDYHKSMDNYLNSKLKLFDMLKPNGVGIVNIDDNYSKYFKCSNLITYGFNNGDYKILDYSDGMFLYEYLGECYRICHNLIGKHNTYNMMCSIIVLEKMGFSFDDIYYVTSNISSPSGRMEIYNYLDNKIIVDYAHTPDAIKQVLSTFSDYNNIYAVFGCTGNRDKEKRPIMMDMLTSSCNYVIVTSDDLYDEEFSSIVDDMIYGLSRGNYSVCYDRREAIETGIKLLSSNDILLVLGKGHEEIMKIGSIRIPFNDGKAVLDIINKLV